MAAVVTKTNGLKTLLKYFPVRYREKKLFGIIPHKTTCAYTFFVNNSHFFHTYTFI